MTGTAETFVVVGAGQAGAWIARTLRAEGFAGRLVLIGREPHQPYQRPPLSKAVLSGAAPPETAILLTAAQAEGQRIECWLGTEIATLDRHGRRVTCADGRVLGYDRLFLTTGGRARTLPGASPGSATGAPPRIHLLRTLDDAIALRAALIGNGPNGPCAATLLVLGGGWIGLEVAATSRGMGVAVTVVESAPLLCARALPPIASAYLHHLHAAHGVTLRLGCAVASLTATAAGVVMALADGTVLTADHAVIGIGMQPETGLAASAGLVVADGIVVDASGRTSDPSIYAAGDAARHPSAFAGTSLRLESWANAQNQAVVAARAALGLAATYAEVPWFWSDQYDVNLQILGLPHRGVRAVARRRPEAGDGAWLMLDADGRAAGVIAVNAPRDLRGVRKMIGDGLTPDPIAWADAATPPNRIGPLPPVG